MNLNIRNLSYYFLCIFLYAVGAGKAQSQPFSHGVDVELPLPNITFIYQDFGLDSIKTEYVLIFAQQMEFAGNFAYKDHYPVENRSSHIPFNQSHLYLHPAEGNKPMYLHLTCNAVETALPTHKDLKMAGVGFYLIPTKNLKKGKTIELSSQDFSQITIIFARPSRTFEKQYLTFEYQAGKEVEFFYNSDMKCATQITDLPTQNIKLAIKVK